MRHEQEGPGSDWHRAEAQKVHLNFSQNRHVEYITAPHSGRAHEATTRSAIRRDRSRSCTGAAGSILSPVPALVDAHHVRSSGKTRDALRDHGSGRALRRAVDSLAQLQDQRPNLPLRAVLCGLGERSDARVRPLARNALQKRQARAHEVRGLAAGRRHRISDALAHAGEAAAGIAIQRDTTTGCCRSRQSSIKLLALPAPSPIPTPTSESPESKLWRGSRAPALAMSLNKFGRVEIVDRPDACLAIHLRPRRNVQVAIPSADSPRVHGILLPPIRPESLR